MPLLEEETTKHLILCLLERGLLQSYFEKNAPSSRIDKTNNLISLRMWAQILKKEPLLENDYSLIQLDLGPLIFLVK